MTGSSTKKDQGNQARNLHEEMCHSITSLLSSLAQVPSSSDPSAGSMEAPLQQVSHHLLVLKKNQRCLGILQGIQSTEVLHQMRTQTEQLMMEIQSITYHLDASSSHRVSVEQSHTHLATVARQETLHHDDDDDDHGDHDDTLMTQQLINAYLSASIVIPDTFDCLHPNHHMNNLNKLQMEKIARQSLVEELEQITTQKQQVIQRLGVLQDRQRQFKEQLDSIQKAIQPLQTKDYMNMKFPVKD